MTESLVDLAFRVLAPVLMVSAVLIGGHVRRLRRGDDDD